MEVMYNFLAIFCGDIPLRRPYVSLTYGRYLPFRILKWPSNHGKPQSLITEMPHLNETMTVWRKGFSDIHHGS